MVFFDGFIVKVKGFKGELECIFFEGVSVSQDNNIIVVFFMSIKCIFCECYGLSCIFVVNMIEGVSNGYSKVLEIVGVGLCVQVKGKIFVVSVGYSYFVEMEVFEGIIFKVENNIRVIVFGIDKELVGNEVVKVCVICFFEFYKGKGIKYEGECILCKVGKFGKK